MFSSLDNLSSQNIKTKNIYLDLTNIINCNKIGFIFEIEKEGIINLNKEKRVQTKIYFGNYLAILAAFESIC